MSADAQAAKKLHEQANSEPNQEKQVLLLCKAADMEAKNKDYRHDCDMARSALITSDKQALKTALDAADVQQTAKAKRYAKYVSGIDPETHRQAEQLLARLNTSDVPVAAAPVQPAPNQSGALLSQALTAYDSGNLAAAKTAAQGVTDANVKMAANRVLSDIDRYGALVSAGRQHEQAKEYAEAERSYQGALDLNGHVSSDDLTSKIKNVRQLATAAQAQAVVAKVEMPKPATVTVKTVASPSPVISADERKKQLLSESAIAMSRNDLDTAGRKFKQVLDIDPSNADAKRGIADITVQLSKDPARLEKTLREAISAFYASNFEDAGSRLNRYLGADGGKKKGAAYFYLGATEATQALLEDSSRRASLTRSAKDDFKQARSAGYQPVEKYVSGRILEIWKSSNM